ncbi:DALR domain-containing protein, partial [Brevibacterium paucivorans]|uniref:DALR domain-containing protein n=1 Tax=Brevibacterium paucivorans TaxID=170994 RepID=UPI0027E3C16B
STPVPEAFAEAMDSDLGIPKALAVVFDQVGAGFRLLDGGDRGELAGVLTSVELMLDILGINPSSATWAQGGESSKGKGPRKGTGGHGRRRLEGKGPTPKAEDRVYHKAHKAKLERQRRQQGKQ